MNDDVQDWRRERLAAASDKAGGDAELGRLLGHASGAQIGHMRLGRRPVTEKTIEKIEALPGYFGWFNDKRGMPVLPSLNNGLKGEDPGTAIVVTKQMAPFLPGFDGLSIPVLAQAGSMGEGADQLVDEVVVGRLTVSPDWVSRTIKPLSNLRNLRFIHGYGDSMEPTFHDGDILLVDVGIKDPAIDGIYVLEANERIYIKRVRQRLNGEYEVTSDNPIVKTVDDLNAAGVQVCGRVVWVWNGKKL